MLMVPAVIDTPLFVTTRGGAAMRLLEWVVLPDGSVTVVLQAPTGEPVTRRGRDLIPLTSSARAVLTLGDELASTVLWRLALRGPFMHGVAEDFGSA